MATVLRLVATCTATLGLTQAARISKRRQNRDDLFRLVQGGAMASGGPDNPAMDALRNLPARSVKYISAAHPNPVSGADGLESFLTGFGVKEPEWIPVYADNCAERTQDPKYVRMVEEAAAIYLGGGQSGRVSSCLFGNYSQSGIDGGQETPLLKAIRAKLIVAGSSAGAMTQPMSEIIVTGHSAESYDAVRRGELFQRDAGNGFVGAEQAVDTHFSERGRQGRLLVFAVQTQLEWAFGVDESTAYIWRPSGVYEVVGPNGVVIFQGATGTKDSQSARMHYLTHGDTIDITTGEITYNADKSKCSSDSTPNGSRSVFDGNGANVYKDVSIATAKGPTGVTVNNYHGWWTQVQVDFRSDDATVAMCGSSGESFEGLLVQQYSRSQRVLDLSEREKPNVPEHYIYPMDD